MIIIVALTVNVTYLISILNPHPCLPAGRRWGEGVAEGLTLALLCKASHRYYRLPVR
jgi:hypothetical protein